MIPELGFKTVFEVDNLLSVAHLFTKQNRCGIYCLKFSNDQFYIGRAVDFARRFTQHRKTYDDIVAVAFFDVPKKLQAEIEKTTIRKAETAGFKLRNKEETSVTYADCDFDELIPINEQEQWLASGKNQNLDYRIAGEQVENQRIRFVGNFKELASRPDFDRLIEVLKLYVQKTLPFYRQTEMSFWSISCTPSTNKHSFPRLFVININFMECLVVMYHKKFPNMTHGFLVTSKKMMEELYGSIRKFENRHIESETFPTNYVPAGFDQIGVVWESIGNLEQLLKDEKFCSTLRYFNLQLMKKRACFYSKYHCFDLADLIV